MKCPNLAAASSWIIVALIAGRGAAIGAEGDLASARAEIELARTYKYKDYKNQSSFFFHATGTTGDVKAAASYDDLIAQFQKRLEADKPGKRTPQELYRSAINTLTRRVASGESGEAAEWLRDGLAEYIEGETLVGNQSPIDALRSQFPRINKEGKATESLEPADLVNKADARFRDALDALRVLHVRPDLFRDGDEGNPGRDNPFGFVKNGRGEEVLNELKITLNAVERKVRAGVTRGKLLFNESGKGKAEDLNDNRTKAKNALKASGQEGYLWLATAALHGSPTALSRNGSGEIRSQIGTAERVFQMIRRGENPDGYVKDFVPSKPVKDLYADAVSAVVEANTDENTARNATREYDNSLQALRSELTAQRGEFRKPLQRLSGLRIEDNGSVLGSDGNPLPFIIATAEGRGQFMQHLRTTIRGNLRELFEEMTRNGLLPGEPGDLSALPVLPAGALKPSGDIGVRLLELRAANLAMMTQLRTLKDYPDRVRIEEERVGSIAQVITETSGQIGAKQFAMGLANAVTFSLNVPFTGTPYATTSVNPGSIFSGFKQREITELQGSMQVTMERTNSAAVIKNLLMEQARAFLEVQQAQNRVVQSQAILENMLTETERLLEDWASTKQGAAEVYLRYPTFRIERDQAIHRAEQSFQRAREAAYFAAKALQYEWAGEEFSNPIGNRGSGIDVPLKPGYEPFARTESLFGAKDTLELRDFLKALYDWHDKMSTNSLRGNPRANQAAFAQPISLRQNLLGYHDELKNDGQDIDSVRRKNLELFRNWLRAHTERDKDGVAHLRFEFATEIDSRRMFAWDEYNQKILRIGVGFRGGDLGVVRPMAQIAQGGTASLRRYPPSPPPGINERVSLSGLGTKELGDVLTRQAEQRTYVKVLALLNPGAKDFEFDQKGIMQAGLQELSVAADRWTFHLNMSDPANKSFPLDQVSDILFVIEYTFNHPSTLVGESLRVEGARLDPLTRR
ncbi:MAG: hypothetical protein JWN86_3375 [Planctomycetota bacterium]|nr:hypothetical protein [Planctomycetota bacterium]